MENPVNSSDFLFIAQVQGLCDKHGCVLEIKDVEKRILSIHCDEIAVEEAIALEIGELYESVEGCQ